MFGSVRSDVAKAVVVPALGLDDQLVGHGVAGDTSAGQICAFLECVVEWEPGERLAYKIEGLPPVVRSVTNTWRLAGAGSATTVTLTSDVDTGPRPPQQAIARVVGKGLAKASRQMLDGLKAHLEEGAA